MTKKQLIYTALILFVATSLYSCDYGKQHPDRGYIVKVGEMAPELTLQLTTGETVSLRDLSGEVVVLQFTASWCSVCRKEMPHLEKEVWLPNKEKDFILIGVDYDEPLDKVVEFTEQMNITYPMALDPNAQVFAKFALKKSGVTRNVVIDQNGKIVFLTRLFNKNEFEAMKQKIELLLK